MNFKKNALFLSLFIIPTIYCSEQTIEIDETAEQIFIENQGMLLLFSPYRMQFPFKTRKDCLAEFFIDYSNQKRDYILRKYTARYTGSKFSEKHWYKADPEQMKKDKVETEKALALAKQKGVENYVYACLAKYYAEAAKAHSHSATLQVNAEQSSESKTK